MWWSRRFEREPVFWPELVRPVASAPCRLTAWGEAAAAIPDWLSAFPGDVEAEVGWPRAPADTASLVALLGLGDLRELDVRAGVETRMRWWAPGRLQIRAPREARFWRGLQARFRDPGRVEAEVRWLQGHRRHEAWLMGRTAGLEMTDGRGYREWTLWADVLPAPDLAPEIRMLGPNRLTARISHLRPKSFDLPREPARVRRWLLHWEGYGPLHRDRIPRLLPSWHYRVACTVSAFGHPIRLEEAHTLGKDPSVRLELEAGVRDGVFSPGEMRAMVRRVGVGRSFWHPEALPRDPVELFALWQARAAAHELSTRLRRPELVSGGPRPVWWIRWPGSEDGLWFAAHPRWPEQAFLVRYPAVGPYAARLEVRWGWHGPRLLYAAGSLGEDLRGLRGAESVLLTWWEGLSAVAPELL